MEATLIEELDNSRFSLIKWSTLGWGLWFGGYILKDFISNNIVFGLILLFGLFGWVLWTINLIKFLKLGKIVNSDIKLQEALNNELHQLYRYKSVFWGFWIMIVTICIFLLLSIFYNLPALIVCEITLYLGILSVFFAALIYNRG